MHIESGARSDVGRVRKNNEDSFRAEPSLELFVLSDGMGGQASGEVASALAVETVVEHCRAAAQDNGDAPDFCGELTPGLSDRTNRLASAIRLANRKIFEAGATDPARKGMGATIVSFWITDRRLSLAHVGDSRAYLLRTGSFEQLTADHSLVADLVRGGILTPQQAEVSEQQSILTRALGTQSSVEVDADEQMLLAGDVLLLCSDGLSRTVTNPEIASTLETHPDPQKAADRLIDLANENGGEDNVTAIVVRVTPEPKGFLARWRRSRPKRSSGKK
ncbi:MAG: Stp1/IreP family PP2C-type Ser/Thr phosphatase [Candidatus Acidiferrales bacterium]